MRILKLLPLLFVVLLSNVSAKEAWLTAQYGNFEFQSDLGEKSTEKVLEEFHYFAQTIERLFPKLGLMDRFPVRVVLTSSARTFKKYSGGKFDVSKTSTVWGSVDGFETLVVYVKNKSKPAQSSSLMFRSISAELFRDSDEAAVWFFSGISQFFATVDISSHGNVTIGKPIDLRFDRTPQDRYDTSPALQTSQFLDAETYFGMKKGSEESKDRINRILTNIQSWICLHYSMFNEDPMLIKRLIKYALYCKNNPFSEESFQQIMGMPSHQFMDALKRYAEFGKYPFTEMNKEEFPPFQKPEIYPLVQERVDATQLAVMLSTRNWEKSIEFLTELNAQSPNHPDVLEANYIAHKKIDARWVEQKGILDADPDPDLLEKATREFNRLAGYERQNEDEVLSKALGAGVKNYQLSLDQAMRMVDQADTEGRKLQMKEIGAINQLLAPTIMKRPKHLEALQCFVHVWAIAEKPAPDSILPHIVQAMKSQPNDYNIWNDALAVFSQTGKHEDSISQIKIRLEEIKASEALSS